MPRLFGINSKQAGIIVTLLVIIFLGACYFFIYVPNNEKNVQERRFRSLQNIDNNFHTKISNDTLLINNLLSKYNDALSLQNVIRTNKYADSLSSDQIPASRKWLQTFSESNDIIKNSDTVDFNENKYTLYAGKRVANGTRQFLLRVRARFSVERFIAPLLPPGVFDNYIVFYKNNKIYETFRSGLNGNADSLLEARNKIMVPGVRSIKVGGTDYKIFSQPVTIMGEKWIISGLVTSKNYLRERDQLPLWIILLLLTAAIGIIVCIPWIKLYHMGNKDKLTVRDGVATVLVSMVLMSLLFFIVFKYDGSLGIFKKQLNNPADTLADKITAAFEGELNQVYNTLERCDSYFCAKGRADAGKLPAGHDKFHDSILKSYGGQLNIHQVYWLDIKGQETYNWITDVNIPPGTNLSARDYFINIKNNRPNWIKGTTQFYLSQNISRASGVFTSVIAKKSDSANLIAGVGFTAKTLDNVIMPDGYQFAIIDAAGGVRYHSRPEFNLNQNLKIEFADSSALVSSIEARSNTNFEAEYFGRRYNVKIRPMPFLPYSVVVLEDLEYSDTRDMESYAFTLSMLMCLLVFLIIETAAVFFVSSKQSFFKKQFLETSWIGPKISSHGQYNMSILVNLFIIGITGLYFGATFSVNSPLIRCSFLEYLYVTLFSITLTSLTLNAIFYKSYKLDKCYKYRYKKRAIICSSAFILFIDFIAFKTLDGDQKFFISHFAYLLYFEIATIGLFALAMKYLDKLLPVLTDFKKIWRYEWGYTHSFALMSTLRLVITSGIPVAFFFMYSYDYEQNLDTRYRQYHFAKDIVSRQGSKVAFRNNMAGVYNDGVAIVSMRSGATADELKRASEKFEYTREDNFAARVLSAFRFRFNTIEVKNNNMNTSGIDNTAFFNKLTWEKSNSKVGAVTYYRADPENYIVLDSLNINYRSSNGFLLLPAILLFFVVMHNIIRKLFALNLPVEDGWEKINKGLITDDTLNKLLLIVGAPGSGKLSGLLNMIKDNQMHGNNGKRLVYNEQDDEHCNVYVADMIVLPAGAADCGNDPDDSRWKECVKKALDKKYSLVIINHLEYNMKDGKSNNMKLDLLEKLMSNGNSKIMIISTVHPVSFLDSYNQQIRQGNSQLDDDSKVDNAKPENELERWMVLFGHFRIIIEPLIDYAKTGNPAEKTKASKPVEADGKNPAKPVRASSDISELPIMKEIQYSHFLHKMERIIPTDIVADTDKIGLQSDSMIFKLQLTSQYFYTYIWQSLTMEEKFLLYDLAEDGLVNSYDDYNLSILISKRLIIISDGTLMLFNKGFRNFILTAIGQTEANRIKEQVKANGNWDSLKTPLLLTMLAILAFLFTSQQEAYSRIVTYITAFSAGIPAILKVFSMFSSSPQKSDS